MYSACLFCHTKLGTNDVLESFPIGRRLAYDAERGRLWVVCRRCGRWNLSPLEERWEAFEECERLFRNTKLRASTDNVGLARLAEGTELVRVGRPQRPELAAWRYGSNFGRRYRTTIMQAAFGPAVGLSVVLAGVSPPIMTAALLLQIPGIVYLFRRQWGIITRIEDASGKRLTIRGHHLTSARLVAGDEGSLDAAWRLVTRHDRGSITVTGSKALWLAGKILSRINRVGGGDKVVESAVARIEHEGGTEALFHRLAAQPSYEESAWARWWYETGGAFAADQPGTLRSLRSADRLALEMASHEEAERRALEGELQALEAAWREAEEIAAIADSLVLPARVENWLAKQRGGRDVR